MMEFAVIFYVANFLLFMASHVVALEAMLEAAAEAARAALIGIDVGMEDEVVAVAGHVDPGLQLRIPIRFKWIPHVQVIG